ncbi:type II toxin-antitoxin system Phd/YefM family antitoxin [Streptosporangium sp. NPDC003464]
MDMEQIGIVEARKRLGTLVSRAVHAHVPVRISRSADEHAVLISEDDYTELQKLRAEREIAEFQDRIDSAGRGETTPVAFETAEQMYSHFGVSHPGERR